MEIGKYLDTNCKMFHASDDEDGVWAWCSTPLHRDASDLPRLGYCIDCEACVFNRHTHQSAKDNRKFVFKQLIDIRIEP